MTARERADRLLVARGLFESRAKAQAAIAAGRVTADGEPVRKPSDEIARDAQIAAEPAFPWVSRGGVKLAHALDRLGIAVDGRVCLDVGASTGGFTEVLIARGARRVFAVDVGRDQLHASLRGRPEIVSIEETDIRKLDREQLLSVHDARAPSPRLRGEGRGEGASPQAHDSRRRPLTRRASRADLSPQAGRGEEDLPSLVTVDVSFISLKQVLPAALALASARATLVALIKPQFEVGKSRALKKGIVRDREIHAAVCADIAAFVAGRGWEVLATLPSPIEGGDGNREFLIGARRG